jgi:hypothetical protein
MGVVTLSTLADAVMLRSIRGMTLSAFRDDPILSGRMVGMAIRARYRIRMCTPCTFEIFNLICMTGGALIDRCPATPAVISGLMGRMTADTVGITHIFAVGFMAFHTLHELPFLTAVFQMAIGTAHMGMRTGKLIKSTPDILMTGETHPGHILTYDTQRFHPGSMGRMATDAVVKCVVCMCGRSMTLRTFRNYRGFRRRMPLMAIKASEGGSMRAPFFRYLLRRVHMALYTVRIFQRDGNHLRLRRNHAYQRYQQYCDQSRTDPGRNFIQLSCHGISCGANAFGTLDFLNNTTPADP